MTHPTDETLNGYVERELSPAEHVRVATHLETCAECTLVVADIQQIVREAAGLGPIEPPQYLWSRIEERLGQSAVDSHQSSVDSHQSAVGSRQSSGDSHQAAVGSRQSSGDSHQAAVDSHQSSVDSHQSSVDSHQSSVDSHQSAVDSRQSSGDRRWTMDDRRWLWAAATAALVVLAFLTGRFVHQREQSAPPQAAAVTVPPAGIDQGDVRERVLLIAVGDHLERSQMVLVELAHAETRGQLDISAERQLADDLVASNRLYRQTAQQMGQQGVATLLDDLERVLIEVARGPSTVSMRQLADIQQRIESQGILFKVKVIGSDIRKPPVS